MIVLLRPIYIGLHAGRQRSISITGLKTRKVGTLLKCWKKFLESFLFTCIPLRVSYCADNWGTGRFGVLSGIFSRVPGLWRPFGFFVAGFQVQGNLDAQMILCSGRGRMLREVQHRLHPKGAPRCRFNGRCAVCPALALHNTRDDEEWGNSLECKCKLQSNLSHMRTLTCAWPSISVNAFARGLWRAKGMR
jgi:hypothetical protein